MPAPQDSRWPFAVHVGDATPRASLRGPAPATPLPRFPLAHELPRGRGAPIDPWDDATTPYIRRGRRFRRLLAGGRCALVRLRDRPLTPDALRFLLGITIGMLAVLVVRGDAQDIVSSTRRLVANELLQLASRETPSPDAEEPPLFEPPTPFVAEPRVAEPIVAPAFTSAPVLPPAPPPIVLAQRPIPTVDLRDLPRVRRHR